MRIKIVRIVRTLGKVGLGLGKKKKKKVCPICGQKYSGQKCFRCDYKVVMYPPKSTQERVWNNKKDEVWNDY